MPKVLLIKSILVALLLITVSILKPAIAKGQVRQTEVEQLFKKSKINKDEISLIITDSKGATIAEINSEKSRIPASVTKIFTAYSVFKNIPPGTKVKTQIRSDSLPVKGVLKGDIYLVGAGDPGFVSETLWFLVNSLKRTGLKEITGDIIVDDSLFDQSRFDPSRQEERVDRAYDAPVGAMSFNWNSVNVFMRPTSKGEAAAVFLDPENSYTKLVNRLKTGTKTDYSIDRTGSNSGDTITVTGTIELDSKELVAYKSITKPDLWSGFNLKEFLSQRGIQFNGTIKTGKASKSGMVIAEAESKPIENMVSDMNKFSNNYVAEMLTKLHATQMGKAGTIDSGMELIRDAAKKCGVDDKDIKLINPSGLTTENRITVIALHKVLKCIQNDFRIFPEFLSSLPIAGVDGTLKNRMKSEKAFRWVRAKTGLLTGVTALAGFAGKPDGTIYTFVLLQNGKTDGSLTRQVFDQVITSILN